MAEGLRERKKQQTRTRIVEAALDMCDEQGFDRTTVEQIAEAADVSPRTVSRYFETKEDIVLGLSADFIEAAMQILRSLPVDGNELRALRDCHTILVDRIVADDEPVSFARFQQMQRVIKASPSVDARSREVGDFKENAIAETIAQRLGVPVDDLSVRVVVSTWGAIAHAAMVDCETLTAEECRLSLARAWETFEKVCG